MPTAARMLEHSYRFLVVAALGLAASLATRGVAALAVPQASAADLAGQHGEGRPRVTTEPARHLTLRRDVFCSTCGQAEEGAAAPPTSPPEESCASVRVHGIVRADDVEWSFAALTTPDGASLLRRKGGGVGGEEVAFVGEEEVWLRRHDGTLCVARMFAPPEAPSSKPPPPPKPPALAGVRQVDASHVEIERGLLERASENIDLLRGTPVVPVTANGRVTGLKVMRVQPKTLLDALGIRAGDELHTINGYDVTDPRSALEAYTRLPTADHLVLVLQRDGKAMQIDYDVR